MMPQSEGPGIEEVMNGAKGSDTEEKILLEFSEIWRRVKDHHSSDIAEMERGVEGCFEGFDNMAHDQRW